MRAAKDEHSDIVHTELFSSFLNKSAVVVTRRRTCGASARPNGAMSRRLQEWFGDAVCRGRRLGLFRAACENFRNSRESCLAFRPNVQTKFMCYDRIHISSASDGLSGISAKLFVWQSCQRNARRQVGQVDVHNSLKSYRRMVIG